MMTQSHTLVLSDSLGSVSAEVIYKPKATAIITLAHGAGAGMHHSFMIALSEALAQHYIATLRFNFPYMEQHKKRPDVPAIAHKTIAAALIKARELFPDVPLYASGKSFGGRMSSQYLSQHVVDLVKGLIFFGFPLHPAKQPSTERAEHLKKITIPMLFLQGTRDTLAEWDLMEGVAKSLPRATLQKFEGADHSFKKGKENLIPGLAAAVKEWIRIQSH